MTAKFTATAAETDLILQIVDRAVALGAQPSARLSLTMDVTACHCNGTPLDFPKLLAAPDADFSHDLCGISRHIDRTTGQLGGCFLPRCALPAKARPSRAR
jgi:hypothetical protein